MCRRSQPGDVESGETGSLATSASTTSTPPKSPKRRGGVSLSAFGRTRAARSGGRRNGTTNGTSMGGGYSKVAKHGDTDVDVATRVMSKEGLL